MLWRFFYLQWVCLNWTVTTIKNQVHGKSKPIHVLFCTTDHYEPGTADAPISLERERVDTLLTEYPKLVKNHRDAGGNVPKRTWFFPPHYHRNGSLGKLVSLCEQGYGEIELHLHHGRRKPDTAENLKQTIEQCVKEYSNFGIFGSEQGQKRYAFIHGDWALDNSRAGRYCGVNNELRVLKETGCYADFTLPSLTQADSLMINSIYYAQGIYGKAKSYNTGTPVRRGGKEVGDLMLIQGPVYPFIMDSRTIKKTFFRLRALGDTINIKYKTTKERIDAWVRTWIHIPGKPDWIIIKTSTHGAVDANVVLGQEMEDVFSYLETKYNDGENFVLHYVTARELYNIIKAIEAGESCRDPEEYRDYKIRRPIYNSQAPFSEASSELMALVNNTY